MHKACGLIFASALLCAGSAYAFERNTITLPTVNRLNPPPPPPSSNGVKLAPGGNGTNFKYTPQNPGTGSTANVGAGYNILGNKPGH
jgi:hypothetical protein